MDGPETVYGVDFSGAKDAERNIWIAGGPLTNNRLEIDTVGTARSVFDQVVSGRDDTHEALVDWLREKESAVVGMDFPFGLPEFLVKKIIEDSSSWTEFVEAFPPDNLTDESKFAEWGKEETRTHSNNERTFCKRETDGPVGAKSPYGFIGDTITFYGIRNVLFPLVSEGEVTVPPMQKTAFEPPLTILETYPSGTLDQLGLCRQNYKGGKESEKKRRRRNLDGLTEEIGVSLADSVDKEEIIENAGGDALDAVVAAAAAFRAVENEFQYDDNRYDEREGYIYV